MFGICSLSHGLIELPLSLSNTPTLCSGYISLSHGLIELPLSSGVDNDFENWNVSVMD